MTVGGSIKQAGVSGAGERGGIPLPGVALGHGGTGTVERWDNYGGRRCYRTSTDAIPLGSAWLNMPPGFDPIYGPLAANGGARVNEQAAVCSFSLHFAVRNGAAPPDNDRTGYFFLPWSTTGPANVFDYTPFGGLAGGFGLFYNDDGAGNPVWEHVTWDGVTILDRTRVPALVLPDVTRWSTARWVIVTGGGSPATVEFSVNSAVVRSLEFDDVELMRPSSVSAVGINGVALGYMFAEEIGPLALAEDIFTSWEIWQGRFTPAGVEVEPL